MTNLTILSKSIRQIDNLYSLNDLHKISGEDKKHKPTNFIRLAQTQELVAEINRCSDLSNAIKIHQGGKNQGTFVCKELVYSYAMWISAKFSLMVIRAFDEIQTALQPQLEINHTDKQQEQNYKLINNMIAHMDLPNHPVVVPYSELATLINSSRYFQKVVADAIGVSENINESIKNLKTLTDKSFGDL